MGKGGWLWLAAGTGLLGGNLSRRLSFTVTSEDTAPVTGAQHEPKPKPEPAFSSPGWVVVNAAGEERRVRSPTGFEAGEAIDGGGGAAEAGAS